MEEQERIKFMRQGLRLAAKGAGWVEPNPRVGAVIVKEGRIIGQGYHQRFGGAHAEVEAIADCRNRGEDARGALMLVTLEPCCHQGKTGPCTKAIAAAGIAEVEIATLDEFEPVSGKGAAWLRERGIKVQVGCCEREARQLNAGFFKLHRQGLPQVILKWAQSIDGKLAWSESENQRWITNEKARRHVHKLRSQCGAIVVGMGTVRADDPLLTARGGRGMRGMRKCRQPRRVVLDSRLRIPAESQLVRTAKKSPVLIYTTAGAMGREVNKVEVLRGLGCELIAVGADEGRIELKGMLRDLGGRGVTDVLVEGGATVLQAFWEKELADKVMVYIAPVIIGEEKVVPAITFIRQWRQRRDVVVQQFDGDVLFEITLTPAPHVK